MKNRKKITQETIEQAVRDVYERDGIVTPRRLVEVAQDPSHPLHEDFIWDDAEAGRIQREDHARRLIRSVKITVKSNAPTSPPVKVSLYVHNTENQREQGYTSIRDVEKIPDLAARQLERECRSAIAIVHRASGIARALGFGDRVDTIRDGLASILADLLAGEQEAAE